MIISKIESTLNKLTPGIPFKQYAKKVLYHGQDCGYIEAAGKRKYILTPAIDKLEHKLDINNFDIDRPRKITPKEFNYFKLLLKPFIKNEKGFKKMNLNKDLYYSPSVASILVWDEEKMHPVVTIIKKLKSPTKEVLCHKFPFLRNILKIN